jgi:antitoxin component YwqK of YwqJK toxin-antitoxin module
MKPFIILSIFFLISLATFGQKPVAIDSGFTNKDSAKNLLVNGLKEGRWIEYIGDTGEITTDTSASSYYLTMYKADKPYGIQREYAKGGRLQFEAIHIPGKKEPRAIFFNYYPSGKLQSEFSYMGDKPDGKFKWYYENGKLKNETDYALGVKGAMKFFDEIGNKISANQFAIQESGFTNKAEALNKLVNGKKEGKWAEYMDSSFNATKDTNAIIYVLGTYKTGKKNGIEKIYFDGIIMFETPYNNDAVNGIQKEYDETGKLEAEHTYGNGKLNGVEKIYYQNGKIRVETYYMNSLRNGEAKEYYESGKLKSRTLYKNGIPEARVNYFENGKEIK